MHMIGHYNITTYKMDFAFLMIKLRPDGHSAGHL